MATITFYGTQGTYYGIGTAGTLASLRASAVRALWKSIPTPYQIHLTNGAWNRLVISMQTNPGRPFSITPSHSLYTDPNDTLDPLTAPSNVNILQRILFDTPPPKFNFIFDKEEVRELTHNFSRDITAEFGLVNNRICLFVLPVIPPGPRPIYLAVTRPSSGVKLP